MQQIDLLRERVSAYLAQMDLRPMPSQSGLYLLKYGSTVVMISLFESHNHVFCRVASIVLTEVDPSLELLQCLLRLNTEVLFGSFLLFEDNTVSFSTTLLGDQIEFQVFEQTLEYVAKVSDDCDERLQELGGGRRAQELLSTP